MADYRELLRKAIDALPDNTGANRRAVYEKARTALVAQLRAIEPPLPAREITTHRLALEDCIREVEHEATEKLLGRFRAVEDEEAAADEAEIAEDDGVEPEAETEFTSAVEPEPEDSEPVEESETRWSEQFDDEPDEITAPETDDAIDDDRLDAVDVDEDAPVADEPGVVDERQIEDDEFPARPETIEPDAGEAEPVEPNHNDDDRLDATGDEWTATTDAEDWTASEPAEPERVEPEIPDAETVEPETPEAETVEPETLDSVEQPDEPDTDPVWDAQDSRAIDAINEAARSTENEESEHEVQESEVESAYGKGSIEDIIAAAEMASNRAREDGSDVVEPEDPEPTQEPDATAEREAQDNRVIPFITPHRDRGVSEPSSEKHFLLKDTESEPASGVPLVDLHGRPLGQNTTTAPGTAMSSVREVDLEPGIIKQPQISDAQVAIDRAIAALDREAQGNSAQDATSTAGDADEGETAEAGPPAQGPSSGPGALTIFLVISVLLLGGGGAAGYWAWQQGYIDLNSVFAQGAPDDTTEVAQADTTTDADAPADEVLDTPAPGADGVDATPSAANTTPSAANTTPEVPTAAGDVDASPLPDGDPVATETPSVANDEPEVSFEDRLPAEADEQLEPSETMTEEPDIAAVGDGLQSLLLEEQASGATGAVPYSGTVEWSRGSDELGNPTIIAEASIPARNLDVEVLIRRNGDDNLPASHLMEVNFDVAETFVGGSIANLPGVLLKDEELVQGQPLTGASARIVGNSFLFALSSASELDVENNIELLTDRDWVDLAMVYGTGRRAIMTLEKGEEGQAIFDDVLAAWSELDAEAVSEDDGDDEAETPAETGA